MKFCENFARGCMPSRNFALRYPFCVVQTILVGWPSG